jgi:hypothetical protein
MDNDETIAESLVFSDEATLLTSCKANLHNLRVCCTENLATLENQRNSPKVNVYCAVSRSQVYGSFSFAENTANGINYLDVLQNWRMPQLTEHDNTFIFQQNGAPPHFHRSVFELLNATLANRWIRRAGAADEVASSPSRPRFMLLPSVRFCKGKNVCHRWILMN